MNLSRSLACALLSLLLLASQQMGIVHALSHYRSGDSQMLKRPASAAKSLALDQSCEQCLAFAQIGSALDTPFRSFPAARAAAVAVAPALARSLPQRTVCVFDSRAPPVLS